MEQYAIKGGNPLVGEVEIGGAKNAALAILAAAAMTEETVVIENVPDLRDTAAMLEAMESIGIRIEKLDRHTVKINAGMIESLVVEDDSIKKIRASYYFWGHFLVSSRRRRWHFPADAISGSGPLTSISRDSVHLVLM